MVGRREGEDKWVESFNIFDMREGKYNRNTSFPVRIGGFAEVGVGVIVAILLLGLRVHHVGILSVALVHGLVTTIHGGLVGLHRGL